MRPDLVVVDAVRLDLLPGIVEADEPVLVEALVPELSDSQAEIRTLLRNERYVGRWAWNRRQWISISGSKFRRPTMRNDDELVVRELPELAIISRDVWDAAVARRTQLTRANRGRHPTQHLFSGLVRCGMCDGGMSVMSTKVKNGRRYVAYGCNVSRTKGDAICSNRVFVSELQLLGFVRDALRELPSRPEFQESFLEAFQATVEAHDAAEPGLVGVDALRAQEERVARLVDAIADAGGSHALTARLRDEEAKLEALKRQRQVGGRRAGARRPLKDGMEAARAVLRNAAELLGRERTTTRAALVAMLEPMKLTPTSGAGGPFYEVEAKIKIPANQGVDREVLSKTGCGGAM